MTTTFATAPVATDTEPTTEETVAPATTEADDTETPEVDLTEAPGDVAF